MADNAPKDWTIADVVRWMTDDLKKRSVESARVDAELIVGQALGLDRIKVVLSGDRLLTTAELEAIRTLFRRRRSAEPVAYLRGFREFYGRPFRVDRRVLVPRPDTEVLVEQALARLAGRDLGARVVDLCTGSGCVGVTLKLERPTIAAHLTDLSAEAIAVARDNAARLGAVWAVSFGVGDLFDAVPASLAGKLDLVTANPPYIATAEIATLAADIREHEPHLALDGGSDGLAIVDRIVPAALGWLRPGGALAMEIGSDQGAAVAARLTSAGFTDVRVTRDYGGLDRVVSGVRPTRSDER